MSGGTFTQLGPINAKCFVKTKTLWTRDTRITLSLLFVTTDLYAGKLWGKLNIFVSIFP